MDDVAGPERSVIDARPTSRRELREARSADSVPNTEATDRAGISSRAAAAAQRQSPRPAVAISVWDAIYFLVELAVYSGVSVAALRLVGGQWSHLTPLGLLAAAVAIVAMAACWALWAAPHSARRPGAPWSVILEYGWMVVGVAGWLVAGLPAIGIPLAGAVVALAVRRWLGRH